ncbi:carnitine O-palmitoyltransferase 1, liver isoform-like isoform X2 [Lineus longissimus]|uniref:carnitine O-palmitoyltransferase 1, liver isoform-like isoform X2 n=1 Tax=Lineus longissimus TaxID=88925 RepID=UPI002B4C2E65
MAEARSAVLEPRVEYIEEGREPGKDFVRALTKSVRRRFFRTRNLIRNGMWPTSIWNLGLTVGLLSLCLIGDWSFVQPINRLLWALADFLHIHPGIPFGIRIILVTFSMGFLFFLVLLHVRRYTLRVLLSYRGWMYERPHSQSWRTVFWAVVVMLWRGYSPITYSYQQSLPRMPVPPLKASLARFLGSIEPLYDEEKFKELKSQAEDFEKTLGPKLQKILQLKSWWAQNYVTDWWEKYVYLMGRSPIAINSNYYALDQSYWTPTKRQVSRAAVVVYQFVRFKRLLDREEVPPLLIRNTIPLCMNQYERAFSTTRIPGEDIDELVHYDSAVSKHIIVKAKGLLYKLDMFDSLGAPLAVQHLEHQLQWILDDATKQYDEVGEIDKAVSALTGLNRTEWHRIRKKHFRSGINKESIDVIEKAIMFVILDDISIDGMSNRGKYLLHGDGTTFWFDKSLNLCFFTDGRLGMNVEHAWGDAPVMAHISEYVMTNEVIEEIRYTSEGYAIPERTQRVHMMRQPLRLLWDINEELGTKITQAVEHNRVNNDDLDLCVRDHSSYGKGLMKKLKVSPDAYIQLALQLAYYRDAGKLTLVYESSMTRLYLHGRTETVRSLTKESYAFVKAFSDSSTPPDVVKALLRKACDVHQGLYRDAMNGKGLDRHMFALYVACKGSGNESEFLHNAMTIPWTLSTSQQPQQQIAGTPDCNLPLYANKVCPGGGFGPVSDDGYGVSYMIPGDKKVFFHVSSKKKAPQTDSKRFMDLLFEALDDMRKLFAGPPVEENGHVGKS